MARPTSTPALKVRSTTPPVFRLRSFVRTNAPPLPGLTCWNSMTWKSVPSRSRVIPRFRSLVLTLTAASHRSQDDQLLARAGKHVGPRRPNLHHVLDPHSTQPLQVDAGLHGDHRSFGQRLFVPRPEPRPLVDLQPNAVPHRVHVLFTVPGLADDLPGDPIHLLTWRAGPDGLHPGFLGPANDRMDLPELGRGLPEGDGPG